MDAEKILAVAVVGKDRLGSMARPLLLELVEADTEGVIACCYRIAAYRADDDLGEPRGYWPFASVGEGGVDSVRQRVRDRWMEATREELPEDVFGEGVSA